MAALACLLIGLASGLPAYASLVPMTWGFPVFDQTSSLTAFEREFASASDAESAAVSFPTSADGILGSSFPTITQTSAIDDLLSSVKFLQQQETSRYASPFISIGYSPIPAMGFF
jgi:hypothetical protein